ncbi:MAG: methyltransferase [Sphingobium sp.]
MYRLILPSIALGAMALPALPLNAQHHDQGSHAAQAPASTIAAAVASPERTPANVARDRYRHPAETLAFFGVTPEQTVVEFSPAGGWYSEILAPLLRDEGRFYALQPGGTYLDRYKAFLAAKPQLYEKVTLVAFPEDSAKIPAESVDTVLTFRNIHNLVMSGKDTASFKAFYDLLKPGGILGIVDHRLPEDRDAASEKTSGYLKVSTIKRLAAQAGFELVDESEINANPRDTADWPKGVWTLPPTLGQGDTDKAKYLAIGESDRMTLKFRKPSK